ncbi:enolase C-terminal domain-like protein [Streptomyces sp. NPDC006711]|uniref:enolase C-terminal domain-like protein n=1 Tax=Streptomyces sp. NPDC006711 TaxID=3364762 RepID=UPI003692EF15
MAAKPLAHGMGTFFKDCDHSKSKWPKYPHTYKIPARDAVGTQRVESGFSTDTAAIVRLSEIYNAKRSVPGGAGRVARVARVPKYGAMRFGEYAAEWRGGQRRHLMVSSLRHLHSLLEHHVLPALGSRWMDSFHHKDVDGFIGTMERNGASLETRAARPDGRVALTNPQELPARVRASPPVLPQADVPSGICGGGRFRGGDQRMSAPLKAGHRPFSVALAEPFTSDTGVTTHVERRLLVPRWQGLTGYGTTRAASAEEFDAVVPLLEDAGPLELVVRPGPIAYAGTGRPVCPADHAGPCRPRRALPLGPTALSLGAGADDEPRRRGRGLAHWPVLKLKLTPQDDGSRAGVLREVYDGRIRVDGNGSWSPGRAVAVAHGLHRHGVELLEQPIPPGPADRLRHVHENVPLPVIADEYFTGPEDVLRLRGCATGVNIKLIKCGGLRRAQETVTLARQTGPRRVMHGCKTESALSVTAMAQLAPLADYLDLDGHVDLLDDPFRGLRIDRGRLTLPGGPGLGMSPAAPDTTDGEDQS